jgi:hypothetical protein
MLKNNFTVASVNFLRETIHNSDKTKTLQISIIFYEIQYKIICTVFVQFYNFGNALLLRNARIGFY